MALVDAATAVRELRLTLEPGEEVDLERKLEAAEEQAVMFLGRNVFGTPEELDAAKASAPALATAWDAYESAMTSAAGVDSTSQRGVQERLALDTYNEVVADWERTMRGMVVNDSITTAILLITGSLWEHRGDEDVIVGVPPSAERLLWPFRVGIGV